MLFVLIGIATFCLGYYYTRDSRYEIKQLNASPWTWKCHKGKEVIGGHNIVGRCSKEEYDKSTGDPQVNMMACKMTCNNNGMLWPKPTGSVTLSNKLTNLLPGDISITVSQSTPFEVQGLILEFRDVFEEYLALMHPKYEANSGRNPFASDRSAGANVKVIVSVTSNETRLTMDTDESYSLTIQAQARDQQRVEVTAHTYFGARHALETLSQLISYNDLTDSLQMHDEGHITDKPEYVHRGLLIDTSRNFFSLKTMKRIVDGLSYNKLNVLHWHLTDTHSFPLKLRSVPELAEYGAYSQFKVYSASDVRELVEYARVRGVKVMPEFDAPAHVGNGWQYAEKKHPEWGRLAVCVNQEEWQDYCVEPPCGQLNIVNDKMYDVLGKVYKEMFEMFDTDVFHMGGDEVNMNCYNTSKEIRDHFASENKIGTEEDILDLWRTFQRKALRLVVEGNHGDQMPAILWTNTMTEKNPEKYLPKDDYIIQIWTKGTDHSIQKLVEAGYKTIFSNYDAWYFDCGYAGWVGAGNNWCAPYKGWQLVYDNSPRQLYRNFNDTKEENVDSILGGEACMWSEQVAGEAIEGKLWPRGAALGERLWSDPPTDWKQAEYRMIHQRERMYSRGIAADALQPEWCHQNEALCYWRTT